MIQSRVTSFSAVVFFCLEKNKEKAVVRCESTAFRTDATDCHAVVQAGVSDELKLTQLLRSV